jgi:hypothetical protein
MYSIKSCPQCGVGEGIYAAYLIFDGFRLVICYHCGFRANNYWLNGDDAAKNHDIEPGFGMRFITYTKPKNELFEAQRIYFDNNTIYDYEVRLFDRLIARGIIIPEKSFITKADDRHVEFLRGEVQNIKNTFSDDYRTLISKAESYEDNTNPIG